MSCCGNKKRPTDIGGSGSNSNCCTSNTGCSFSGSLRDVITEPIYTQKVYDSALFNLQGLKTVTNQPLRGNIPSGFTITGVKSIKCKRHFDPSNVNSPDNLKVTPCTTLSGAQFIEDCKGNPVSVIGPDGLHSQKIIYADTQDCDDKCKGTPVFGTQILKVSGKVDVEIEAIATSGCRNKTCNVTLVGRVSIDGSNNCNTKSSSGGSNTNHTTPLQFTNFFELCVPSVNNTAFLPRLTEFNNVHCETRLATNNVKRDIKVDGNNIFANLMISICITTEQSVVVPAQLCVLSTGFPELSPATAPVCETFPSLFPNQLDERSVRDCLRDQNSSNNNNNDHSGGCRPVRGLSESLDVESSSFDE